MSNKLLLGGFLAVILLISSIHITLYAKYKNGNYTIYNSEDALTPDSMQLFPGILFVSLKNLPDATVKFGEAAGVEKIGESEDAGIQYLRKGDTLQITGNRALTEPGLQARHHVTLNLPYNATLSASNCLLSFRGGKDNVENNPVIYLQKSTAVFSGAGSGQRFGHLKIVASDSSSAIFHGNTRVSNLEVRLSNSSIDYTDGDLGQLSIATDSISRISLQSKHLSKAKITTTAQ